MYGMAAFSPQLLQDHAKLYSDDFALPRVENVKFVLRVALEESS